MSLSDKSYNFFLNEYDSKYTRVTLDKNVGNNLVPVLPHRDFMFVHWSADDNKEHWKDMYEVPLIILDCPCCAYCWRSYGDYCVVHMDRDKEHMYQRAKKTPIKMTGWDFVTYVDTPRQFPAVQEVSPAVQEASPAVQEDEFIDNSEVAGRRSKRIRKQTEFYYGF